MVVNLSHTIARVLTDHRHQTKKVKHNYQKIHSSLSCVNLYIISKYGICIRQPFPTKMFNNFLLDFVNLKRHNFLLAKPYSSSNQMP